MRYAPPDEACTTLVQLPVPVPRYVGYIRYYIDIVPPDAEVPPRTALPLELQTERVGARIRRDSRFRKSNDDKH